MRSGEGKALWGPGDMYTLLVTGDQTAGTVFAMEGLVPPGGGPPHHIHDREDETLYIVEGECEVQIGDDRMSASTGDFVWMSRCIPHRFSNTGTEQMRLILTFTPAGIERFFEEVFEDVHDRTAPPPPTSPELIQRLVTTAPRYGLEFFPLQKPRTNGGGPSCPLPNPNTLVCASLLSPEARRPRR
jgi:quercetin dioxygenase-like cupin family protein